MSHILPEVRIAEVCLSTVQSEIAALEERLRVAELGPDPRFFEEVLADDVVLVSFPSGQPYRVKLIVTLTTTGTGTPFRRVGKYSHCRTASSAA